MECWAFVSRRSSGIRCIFGQNAAGCQIVGLLMLVLASITLAFVPYPIVRVLGCIAIPVGMFVYVILGHAPIYGWFLWWYALRDSFRDRGPRA